jgi:hypothetical protein
MPLPGVCPVGEPLGEPYEPGVDCANAVPATAAAIARAISDFFMDVHSLVR